MKKLLFLLILTISLSGFSQSKITIQSVDASTFSVDGINYQKNIYEVYTDATEFNAGVFSQRIGLRQYLTKEFIVYPTIWQRWTNDGSTTQASYAAAVSMITGIIGEFGSGGGATASDVAYGISWDGNTDAPTKNTVYDKIENITLGTSTDDQTAAEVPITDAGSLITANEVEGALQENRTAINLNTAKTDNSLSEVNQTISASTNRIISSGAGASLRINDSSGRTWFESSSNAVSQAEGNGYIGENVTFKEHTGTDDNEISINFDFNTGTDKSIVATPTTLTYGGINLLAGSDGGNITVPADVYSALWNANNEVPTKNDVYDKIETITAGSSAIVDETATGTTYTPTDVDNYKLKYLKNVSDITVNTPTGTFADGDNITFVQDSVGALKFDFKDVRKGVFYETTASGAVATAHYTGTGWTFLCGLCTTYSNFPLDNAAFVSSFWAEDLGSDATAIASWNDRISTNDATQVTGSKQPLVNVEADGKKAVKFDGVDDGLEILEVAALDFAPSIPMTYVVITGKSTGVGDTFIFHKGNNSSSVTGVEYGIYNSGGDNVRMGIYGVQSASQAQTSGDVDVWILATDGTTADFYKNNVLINSFAVGTADISSSIWLGNRLGNSKYWTGSLRAFAISDEKITPALRATIQAYTW